MKQQLQSLSFVVCGGHKRLDSVQANFCSIFRGQSGAGDSRVVPSFVAEVGSSLAEPLGAMGTLDWLGSAVNQEVILQGGRGTFSEINKYHS